MNSLYHLPLSPFCRKIRLMLAEKNSEVDLIEEFVWDRRTDFVRLNPSSKVPVLKIGDLVLSESNAIFEYIEEVHPNPPLLPKSLVDRLEARRFSSWFDDTFHRDITAKLLYQRVYKNLSQSTQADTSLMKSGMIAMRYHLTYIDKILEQRRWFAGDSMTIADFAGAAHISCLDYLGDVDWTSFDWLKLWYSKIKSRPSFRSLLKDFLPNFPPPQHYSDLDF